MAKTQQDQLSQALAAVNFYGRILQVYPYDLKHRVTYSGQDPEDAMNPILRTYVSEKNEELFSQGTNLGKEFLLTAYVVKIQTLPTYILIP